MMRERDDEQIERAAVELRQPVRLGSAFDDRVMAAVRMLPRHRFGTWARMLRPRTVTLSPILSGIAAVLLFAVALSAGHVIGSRPRSDARLEVASVVAQNPGEKSDVQFVLVAPTARKVAVVGDFNDWDTSHSAFQAEHRGGGVWSVTAPVPVGHHRYSFVVDDSVWVSDPAAPRVIDDDYGMPNSALVVAGEIRR